ncbi:TPA: hypothetical protein ACGO1T_000992 [Streptococcus suis]
MAPQTKPGGLSLWSGLAVVTKGVLRLVLITPMPQGEQLKGLVTGVWSRVELGQRKVVMTQVPSPNPFSLSSKSISAFHV